MDTKFISAKDLEVMLGLKRSKVQQLIKDGIVASGKIGSRRLILRSSAEDIVQRSVAGEKI